jgi:hypothetical protein
MTAARHKIGSNAGPMLTHFTRAARASDALDNLISILAAGKVRGSSRMIRNRRQVVCLFDAPISELRLLLDHRNRHRYQAFGLAIDKRYAFQKGARPAIYLPWREANRILPAEELWRVVSLEIDGAPAIDWSFEREWRLLGDLTFDRNHAVALVDSWQDADSVYEHFDGHPPCAGVIPLKGMFPSAQ